MKDIEKTIIQYEPMMRSLLRKFKIKRDYEDIFQLLRIKTWEVLRDKRYDKLYKNKEGIITDAKFSTWLYKVLSDKLIDILKVDYGVIVKKDGSNKLALTIEKQMFYFLQNPLTYDGYSMPINHNSAHEIKCRLDFELFYNQLSKEDKTLLDAMKDCNGNKKEAALQLKYTVRSIDRKLLILKKQFKQYLIKGEHNG